MASPGFLTVTAAAVSHPVTHFFCVLNISLHEAQPRICGGIRAALITQSASPTSASLGTELPCVAFVPRWRRQSGGGSPNPSWQLKKGLLPTPPPALCPCGRAWSAVGPSGLWGHRHRVKRPGPHRGGGSAPIPRLQKQPPPRLRSAWVAPRGPSGLYSAVCPQPALPPPSVGFFCSLCDWIMIHRHSGAPRILFTFRGPWELAPGPGLLVCEVGASLIVGALSVVWRRMCH